MTTLAVLKADIADDFARTDLAGSIADAITRAISFYQNKRFYFNETRDSTFDTVIDQPRYATADDADIPKFITLDGVFTTVNGQSRELRRISVQKFEMLTDNSASTGEPYSYSYFNMGFGLYPIPGSVYSIRPIGHVMKDGPANDDEPGNVWMTEGYQLIRSRAAAEVALKKVRDYEFAEAMVIATKSELDRLDEETSKRTASGVVKATCF